MKPNLKVENPSLYERLIWDYKNADIEAQRGYIKCSIQGTTNQLPNIFF